MGTGQINAGNFRGLKITSHSRCFCSRFYSAAFFQLHNKHRVTPLLRAVSQLWADFSNVMKERVTQDEGYWCRVEPDMVCFSIGDVSKGFGK
jgi:hypothetical protein